MLDPIRQDEDLSTFLANIFDDLTQPLRSVFAVSQLVDHDGN